MTDATVFAMGSEAERLIRRKRLTAFAIPTAVKPSI